MMALILTTAVVVPMYATRLSNIIMSTSQFARARYVPRSDMKHVLVIGAVNNNSIDQFISEILLSSDLGMSEPVNVVLLGSSFPR